MLKRIIASTFVSGMMLLSAPHAAFADGRQHRGDDRRSEHHDNDRDRGHDRDGDDHDRGRDRDDYSRRYGYDRD
ncbi:MAG TPA: hypothetical protein VJ622_12695, partial [Acidimicrobiia bacterium]|nr:hypothetical protein [Acidimicrobiia bacterium]